MSISVGSDEKSMLGRVTINVNGKSIIYWGAERAVVTVKVSAESPNQASVVQDVAKAAIKVRGSLEKLSTASVTHWSQSSLSTGSYQEYNSEGHKKARIYTAKTCFEVKFRDFEELGHSVTKWSSTEFISIEKIDWRLTDEKKAALMVESRKAAVQDAIDKARDYAKALSKNRLLAISITEKSDSGYPMYGEVAYARGGGRGGNGDADSLSFQPEDVKVSSAIDAVFIAE